MEKSMKQHKTLWLFLSVGIVFFVSATEKMERSSDEEVSHQQKSAVIPTEFLKSASKSKLESCKKLTKHQESKPKPGEPEILIYPSPSMVWNIKNEELYEQCKVETTEETIERLQEQLKKDKERWVQTEQ